MYARHVESLVRKARESFPVVLLTGARQVGKTTLVKALAADDPSLRYLTLDDPVVRDAAATDPDGLVSSAAEGLILDEVQRAPDLLRAVKLAVDRDRRPGRFLLTGSANVLTLRTVSESLAGRVAVLTLHPFSLAEVRMLPAPDSVDVLFSAEDSNAVVARLGSPADVLDSGALRERVIRGGFPVPALMDDPWARSTWFDGYRQTYVERDVRDIAAIADLTGYQRVLTLCALRTGQILNQSSLSRESRLTYTTLRRYFDLLATTYQIFLVRPWLAHPGKRNVKSPKLYVGDTGLGCHLAGVERFEALERQGRAGAWIETLVAGELRKLLALSSRRAEQWYWRTRSGEEVDFVLSRGEEVVGIEVKSGGGFGERDLRGLRTLREESGDRWRMGVLLHGGSEAVPLDDRTVALPFASLLLPQE